MKINAESVMTNRINNKYILHLIVFICLSDSIYKMLRMLVKLNFTIITDYFSYIFHLWGLNAMMTTSIIIICLLGLPKFTYFLRKILTTLREVLRPVIKNPVIVDVPIYVFSLVIVFKLYPHQSKVIGVNIIPSLNITTTTSVYWNEIWKGLSLYQLFSVISIVLFLFGINAIWSNNWIRQWGTRALLRIFNQIKLIYSYLSISIPTPRSLLILLFLDIVFRLAADVIVQSYHLFTNHFILFNIVLIFLYKLFKYSKSDESLQLDFNGEIYLNDVSRLNKTRISSIFYPRTINDIEYLISNAKSQGKTISVRGQAHTMGGQTLPSRTANSSNYVCDLKYMNRVEYDGGTREVFVEAGAT
jgi:hypothetical protein